MSDSSIFIVNYRDPEKPNEMIEVRVRNVGRLSTWTCIYRPF